MYFSLVYAIGKKFFDLPPYDTSKAQTTVYLWKHNYNETELSQWLVFNDLTAGSTKRRIEQLSLRIMCRHLLGVRNNIAHTETGRPFITQRTEQISISHSHGVYALCIGYERTGIDVELISVKAYRLREKFLGATEWQQAINAYPQLSSEQASTMLWSAKEAVFKFFDISDLSLKDDIKLCPLSNNQMSVSVRSTSNNAEIAYYFYPTFVLTCCKAK